jgi:hypothetical protein
MAVAAPAVSAQPYSPSSLARPSAVNEPRVFFFDDGRHAAGLYQFEPPLTASDHVFTVDQLANSGIDTYVYCAAIEGGTVVYDSHVAQKWGENVIQWTHYVWYRAALILQQLIADGHDPLKLLCDRCHQVGIWMLASGSVCLQGGDRATYGGLGRKSDFVYNNPQFQVGEEKNHKDKQAPSTRFSFLHPEVRKERLQVFEELLTRYETDGLELNLAETVPYCRFDQVDQLAPVMTQWIRELRGVARKAEQAQGRRKRIYARIPAHPDSWKRIGYEVPAWISEKLVDGFICVSSEEERMDQDLDLENIVQLTRGSDCRVLASFSSTLYRQLEKYATPPMIWAAAANAYAKGSDGFGLGDAHWTPNGWPWTQDEYQTLRLLGRPELLATADKYYHVRSERVETHPQPWLPGGARFLPRALSEGESGEVSLYIADDLPRWHALGRVKSVRLRVRFTNFQPSVDRVRVELNGREPPESTLEKIDFTYRLLKIGAVSPYGYIFEYILSPEHYPKAGRNRVKVTLLKRDPKLNLPFELYDVDCSIQYRLHRHFEEEPIEY